MIKHFCNKCQTELGKNEKAHKVYMRLHGYGAEGYVTCEYCKKCLTEIIGAETLAEIEEAKAERIRRTEERKAARLARESNND